MSRAAGEGVLRVLSNRCDAVLGVRGDQCASVSEGVGITESAPPSPRPDLEVETQTRMNIIIFKEELTLFRAVREAFLVVLRVEGPLGVRELKVLLVSEKLRINDFKAELLEEALSAPRGEEEPNCSARLILKLEEVLLRGGPAVEDYWRTF